MEPPMHVCKLQAMDAQHLPAQWTPVDQEIIEDLLLTPFDLASSSHQSPPPSSAMPVFPSIDAVHPVQMPYAAPYTTTMAPHPSPLLQHGHAWPRGSLQNTAAAYPSLLGQLIGSDETRKAKHREVQRRFMERKKEQIKRTKQLARQLEMKYDILKLSSEKKDLETENDALETKIVSHGGGGNTAVLSREQVELILEDQLKKVKENYEPITDDEWSELLRKNIDDYEITTREPNYVSTGITVMGWSDRRKQENSSLKFIMSKQFPHLNAAEFMDTTFSKLWLQKTHSSLFNTVVTIKQINDDTIVMHRAFFNPQTNGVVHSIETMCRLQHGHDYIVFLRSPDRNPIHRCVADNYDWVYIWTSLVFSPLPARHGSRSSSASKGGCLFRYGGMLRDFAVPDIKYWLMEMLWVLLRFENVMAAPVFSLPHAEST
ncbi:hypothetical protein FI667_g3276, partial [Globisporangium splendens]